MRLVWQIFTYQWVVKEFWKIHTKSWYPRKTEAARCPLEKHRRGAFKGPLPSLLLGWYDWSTGGSHFPKCLFNTSWVAYTFNGFRYTSTLKVCPLTNCWWSPGRRFCWPLLEIFNWPLVSPISDPMSPARTRWRRHAHTCKTHNRHAEEVKSTAAPLSDVQPQTHAHVYARTQTCTHRHFVGAGAWCAPGTPLT